MAEDYYKILGVSKGASDDEIKKAYRKAAHKHHPDKTGGNEAEFKKVNEAYQVLSDKAKRQQYDQFGHAFNGASGGSAQGGFGGFDFSGFQGFGGQGGQGFNFEFGNEGFEDIFSDIFGGGTRSRKKARGRDIQVDLEISFEEMVKGAHREIKLYKKTVCDHCDGTGSEPDSKKKTCPTCAGSGQVRKTSRSFFGNISQVVECPECQGEGSIYEKKCKKCGGDGQIKKEEIIIIDIPAGIQNEQTISLQGQGEAGGRGAHAGDLYATVRVRRHEKFSRKGQDILSSEYIPFSIAVLGGKIEIETLEGNLILKIPAGTKSGEIFRIKDKGVPELHGRGRGNHLVTVIIKTPKSLSREQKELIERLKDYGI